MIAPQLTLEQQAAKMKVAAFCFVHVLKWFKPKQKEWGYGTDADRLRNLLQTMHGLAYACYEHAGKQKTDQKGKYTVSKNIKRYGRLFQKIINETDTRKITVGAIAYLELVNDLLCDIPIACPDLCEDIWKRAYAVTREILEVYLLPHFEEAEGIGLEFAIKQYRGECGTQKTVQ